MYNEHDQKTTAVFFLFVQLQLLKWHVSDYNNTFVKEKLRP